MPIKPNDKRLKNKLKIPDNIIRIVDKLIIDNWNGVSSKITQEKILDKIKEIYPDKNDNEILDLNWLNIEPIYIRYWNVEYEAPCIGDNFKAYFIFKEKEDNNPKWRD